MLFRSPSADRNQFAVEIYTPEGTSLKKTVAIADSLENIMKQDERIVSITSFKGMSSPRFHTAYAPQMGGENYAQFIVNTESVEATVDILNEYTPKYTTYFPEAIARFKQLSYSESAMPIEVRISGDDLTLLKKDAEKIQSLLRSMPEILLVKNNIGEPLPSVSVELNEGVKPFVSL